MIQPDPLAGLRQAQQLLLEIIRKETAESCQRQYHPDLSPLGWHLGHCVYTETYWIQEVLLNKKHIKDADKALYIPELSVKSERSAALPDHAALCQWAKEMQMENLELLGAAMQRQVDSKLIEDDYLAFFLQQHYAQHIETARYVLRQKQLAESKPETKMPVLRSSELQPNFLRVSQADFQVGEDNPLRHYDNECQSFNIELESFSIAERPLSNAEYLHFMEEGGYLDREHWNEDAWAWRESQDISHPQHWRQDSFGNWFGCGHSGPFSLKATDAVSGISHFEASAVAKWAGAELPHEYQWEAAKRKGLLVACGEVWEWCNNTFHPYQGFVAFPYDGYSLPWFDQAHFVLRGHSCDSLAVIQRDSFRNFYQADKRHFPAGLRLSTR